MIHGLHYTHSLQTGTILIRYVFRAKPWPWLILNCGLMVFSSVGFKCTLLSSDSGWCPRYNAVIGVQGLWLHYKWTPLYCNSWLHQKFDVTVWDLVKFSLNLQLILTYEGKFLWNSSAVVMLWGLLEGLCSRYVLCILEVFTTRPNCSCATCLNFSRSFWSRPLWIGIESLTLLSLCPQMLLKLYQNLALCHLKLKQPGQCIRAANEALTYNSRSPKALFFKAKASSLLVPIGLWDIAPANKGFG